MISRSLHRIACGGLLAILACCLESRAFCQTTGSVQGTVTDQQGAIAAGASLELTNAGTNVTLTQTAGQSGAYFFNSVQPGTYALKTSMQGFKTEVVNGIIVEVNKPVTVDVHLSVGTLTQSVVVNSEALHVELASSQISTDVNEKFVNELPLFTRNALDLAQIAPGVVVNHQIEGGSQLMDILTDQVQVNGATTEQNNFYLDGIDNQAPYHNGPLQIPNPDAIQEVSASTSNTSAEYGRQVGGVFNFITKSGTNQFHGDAYYYFRNSALDANTFQNNLSGVPKPTDYWKEVGGTVGGPIIRNKTFFFLSFMRYSNNSQGILNTHQGVTPQMLNGDFSQLLSGPNPVQLKNPDTGVSLPNNQIPASLIDPVGHKFMSLIPTVNSFGDFYTWAYQQPVVNHEWLGKLDHHWNDKNITSFSILRTYGNSVYPATQASSCCGLALNELPDYPGELDTSGQWTISGRNIYTPKPNLVIEAYAGKAQVADDRSMTPGGVGVSLENLGGKNFPPAEVGQTPYIPGFTVAGNTGVQAQQGWISAFSQTSYQLGGKVTWIKGSHSIKFGEDTVHREEQQLGENDFLAFAFDGRYSGIQNDVGSGFADLLMGRSTGFSQSGILNEDNVQWMHLFFAEDTWKVTPRLTLIPGLRYELYMPAHEANGRASSYIFGHESTYFPGAPVGIVSAGEPGVPAGFYNPQYTNFAPRFGAAYDIKGNGKWSLRGGVGKYFGYNALQQAMYNSQSPPWQPNVGCPGATIISNPWLTCQGVSYSQPPTPVPVPHPGEAFAWPAYTNSVNGYYPDYGGTPYTWQWNATLEHEIMRNVVLQGGYVGSIGRNLPLQVPANWARWAPGATSDGANIVSRRPVPGFGDIILYTPAGRSSYDAFQAVLKVRRSTVNAQATYALQRGYGMGNTVNNNTGGDLGGAPGTSEPDCFYCPSQPNLANQQFSLYFTWDMPFLRDQKNWVSKVIGGWQLSGAFTAISGSPIDVYIGQDYNYSGGDNGAERLNLVGPITYPKQDLGGGVVQWFGVGTTGPNSPQQGPFALPARSQIGNLPPNRLIGPGYSNVDAALMKNFHITERQYFQLRVEGTDILNQSTLATPDGAYFDSTFGQINYRYGSRLLQVALKYYF